MISTVYCIIVTQLKLLLLVVAICYIYSSDSETDYVSFTTPSWYIDNQFGTVSN